jgi:hypothetical protein
MQNTKLLFHGHYLTLPTVKYLSRLNSIQPRCLLHTCLPLMNKDVMKIDSTEEQSHMRMEYKRMYKD